MIINVISMYIHEQTTHEMLQGKSLERHRRTLLYDTVGPDKCVTCATVRKSMLNKYVNEQDAVVK